MNADNKSHAVFVYGTLMQGQRAEHMLNTSVYAGKVLLQDYAMYHLGSYPGIKPAQGEQVFGELYYVDDETLSQMDEYEENGSLYHRTPVVVWQGQQQMDAQVYVYAKNVEGKPLMAVPWNGEDPALWIGAPAL